MLWLILLPALSSLPSAPHVVGDRARPNILLVTVDTLRMDHLGAYGSLTARTPAIDALASHGWRFDRAYTHSPLTFPAHVSIMTAQLPSQHGVRDNGTFVVRDDAVTIAEVLRAAGYRTGAFVGSFILDGSFGLDQGFDKYDDEMPGGARLLDYDSQRPAAAVAQRAIDWIRQSSGQPFFAWVHFYDPHAPYEPPFAYRSAATPYDGEVSAADAGVASLVSAIHRADLAKSTVVVVTADHGEALGEHGEREHGLLLYEGVLRVPLIIGVPGEGPRVVRRVVRHIDLAPTITGLAGLSAPSQFAGMDLRTVLAATGTELPAYAETWYGRLHFGWAELRAITTEQWKYIDGPAPELYDVVRDSGERLNRVRDRSALAARLAAELRMIPRPGAETSAQPRGVESEMLARLRSLGYVGGSRVASLVDGDRPDPKTMVGAFDRYVETLNLGIADLTANRPDSAIARFKRLVAQYFSSFEALHYLGYAYAAGGQHRQAVEAYDRALSTNPTYAVAAFDAARSLAAIGRHDAARARIQQGLRLEPRSFYGHMMGGVVAWAAHADRDAVAAFAAAVALRPSEPRAHANLAEAYMRIGERARARSEFETLIRLNYEPAAAHYNLGVIAEGSGDRTAARDHYRRALAINPDLKLARRALETLR